MKKTTAGGIGLGVIITVFSIGSVSNAGSTRDLTAAVAGMERVMVEGGFSAPAMDEVIRESKKGISANDAGESSQESDADTFHRNANEKFKAIAGAADVMARAEQEEEDAKEKTEQQEETSQERKEDLWGYTNLGIAHVDNHLNVRDSASEAGELVGKMTKDAACEILSVEGDWAKIKSGKVEGYVSTEFLLTGEEAKKRAEEVVYTVATVITETLKVREQPSTECPVITLVGQDERLEVVEQKPEGWVKIMLDDEEAYVSGDYVEIDQELETAVTMKELMYGGSVSNTRIDLTQYAKQFVGNPYVWGGTSLTNGADCSGFVQSVFKKFGISLPRSSREQVNVGNKVSLGDAQPGDLIFYAKGGTINHVALYIGNGQVVHASSPKTGIRISNATYRTPASVKRILP